MEQSRELRNIVRYCTTSSNKPPAVISHPVKPAPPLRIARRVNDLQQGLAQRLRQNLDALKDPGTRVSLRVLVGVHSVCRIAVSVSPTLYALELILLRSCAMRLKSSHRWQVRLVREMA
jgi:hypothetical protein